MRIDVPARANLAATARRARRTPMNPKHRIPAAFLCAALALAAASALAQSPGGPGSSRGGTGGVGPGSAGRSATKGPDASLAATRNDVASTVRFRLELLQEDLALAPAQRAAWSAYSDRVVKLLDDVVRARSVTRLDERPAPQQLDQLADTARNRLTAIEDIVDAGKALYAMLNAEQKALADVRLVLVARPLLEGTTTTAAPLGRPPAGGEDNAPDKAPPRGR
jgi:hypothetical protein